ncbi:MAG: hypothetical protein ACXWPJ_10785 [Candidatus Limnocylindrales bacterium]
MTATPGLPVEQLALDATVGPPSGEGLRVGPAAGRTMDARLARLHLRTGARALARAELETMAGRGELDSSALADLAEVRWRTGDLAGAGEAAQAHLQGGGQAPVAYVIEVEALAAVGRPREARQLANRFLARPDVDEAVLAGIFAGRARSPAWPDVTATEAAAGAAEATSSQAPSGAPVSVPAIEAALQRGDAVRAAASLGVLLRSEPSLAPLVLSLTERGLALADARGTPAALLNLARGDAFRLLGRELEASVAFKRARQALEGPAEGEDRT